MVSYLGGPDEVHPAQRGWYSSARLAGARQCDLLRMIRMVRNGVGVLKLSCWSSIGVGAMKSLVLWLLGVPIVVIILLNVTGMLGH
jgi:hypothetical protein